MFSGQHGELQAPLQDDSVRLFIDEHWCDPVKAVEKLVNQYQMLCLGEIHNYAGRYMLADMIGAAGNAGAKHLFVEVCTSEQPSLDFFLETGVIADLPPSLGGGTDVFEFQRPYLEMLAEARRLGLRIHAIDQPHASFDVRDRIMAENIAAKLTPSSNDKAVVVVGQMHLLSRPFVSSEKSMATLLKEEFSRKVVTVGRAFFDKDYPEFSLWGATANSEERPPLIIHMPGSPFMQMKSSVGAHPLFGSDFDYLFFYPYPA